MGQKDEGDGLSVLLGDIPPESIRVQIVSGSLDSAGTIVNSSASDMTHAESAPLTASTSMRVSWSASKAVRMASAFV